MTEGNHEREAVVMEVIPNHLCQHPKHAAYEPAPPEHPRRRQLIGECLRRIELDLHASRFDSAHSAVEQVRQELDERFTRDSSIGVLGLSVQIETWLINREIKTVGDVLRWTVDEIEHLPRFAREWGPKLRASLAAIGFTETKNSA